MTSVLDRPAHLERAIAKAEDFLLAAQDANGTWRDFLLPAGLSDLWVTAYVAEALVDAEAADRAIAAARRAWAFLLANETPLGGWSYNAKVPGDADSTLWGLRLAETLEETDSAPARRAAAFLDRHLRGDGGLSTYAEAGPIRAYVGLPPAVPFDGWTGAHVCVSAAGANLPRYAERILPYLLARQEEDGGWRGYFWFDREYATAEAVAALVRAEKGEAAIARAADWLEGRVTALAAAEGKVRPAFAFACAARGLALAAPHGEAREALVRAGSALAAWQRETGSWGPSARLRVPPPFAVEPPEDAHWKRWEGFAPGADVVEATFTNFSPDHRGLFGAATALRALRAIERCTS